MTEPTSAPKSGLSTEETIIEWFQRNGRAVAISAVVIVVAAGAYWYYNRSIELKNQAAERALTTAIQSVSAGNAALAQSDLQKVADQYGDTHSGIEAGLLLAQMDYNGGKTDAGVAVLQKLLNTSPGHTDAASIYGLIGDGQMQGGHAAEAAKSYKQAADAAASDADRALEQAKAARAYIAAGDTASAKAIWQKLVDDPKAQAVSAEARVRLGEVEAKPAPKG